ncbi:MAG TPA: hypothetical protein VGI46_13790, partial [Candidatus Acidoferrum sp.]
FSLFPLQKAREYDTINKGSLLGNSKIHRRMGWEFLLYGERIPEEERMATGISYAETEQGVKTAVVDVTNPAFAVAATDEELAAMAEQYVHEAAQQREVPEALKAALRNSMLGKGLMAAAGTFLNGMTTYLLKLGPENLGADAGPIDRRIAASFPAFTARLRLQDMARLLADGLRRSAAVEPSQPVCLVNIGGGAGADSWNALIHLHASVSDAAADARRPLLLAGRKIVIAVMDLDACGPAFGARAVAALGAGAGPLSGLDVEFRHLSFDWSAVGRLEAALAELRASDAACGISSEGGLFEYGTDEEIVSNLRMLHAGTASDAFVVGSVTRDGAPVRASLIAARMLTRPRTIEAFRTLCEAGGWKLEEVIERPFSYHVRMIKR